MVRATDVYIYIHTYIHKSVFLHIQKHLSPKKSIKSIITDTYIKH